jgi:hypothetical protein
LAIFFALFCHNLNDDDEMTGDSDENNRLGLPDDEGHLHPVQV